MEVPRQEAGRVRQKARTRDALVAATRQLLQGGVTPSVEQAADAARVSRTTAYRYFPSQRALLAATFPHLEGGSLLGDHPPADVRARVALFAEKMTQSILANEAEMRAMLRLSLDPQVPLHEVALRQGRRQIWVADALAPLRGLAAEIAFRTADPGDRRDWPASRALSGSWMSAASTGRPQPP